MDKIFAEEVFPSIDEERFRVLYSDRTQCRSNTPVNICIGALIIKELFQISDDEIVENLMLDPRYQYALHTTSFQEQPLSDKTLSRFRKRCYDKDGKTAERFNPQSVKKKSADAQILMRNYMMEWIFR